MSLVNILEGLLKLHVTRFLGSLESTIHILGLSVCPVSLASLVLPLAYPWLGIMMVALLLRRCFLGRLFGRKEFLCGKLVFFMYFLRSLAQEKQ